MFEPKNGESAAGGTPVMSRRNALLSIAALCGLAMTGDVLAAVSKAKAKGPYAPVFLTPASLKLTAVLAELTIPATDTPGALAVGAHRTIDSVLGVCSGKRAQDQFVRGLARIDEAAMLRHGKTSSPSSRQGRRSCCARSTPPARPSPRPTTISSYS
ncbi:gluconate 2-dehydrogenase subunit 3 family protein [Massilia glaciei]|uniref:Gluconate 2-dehydrogenase subunit 3 family protein n=1 Tax=Massilia glaciei TaxID=1524097 RepID=A0A2U2H906_9BURK|nr:gluconate 2-dehydrogenase subunit 3 family protein [Massilia glaciei]